MTACPIVVGDRVRARSNHVEGARVGVVVHIGDQTPRGYGEPYSVGVRLDDDDPALGGSVLGYRLSELERIDPDPRTSSAPMTEDPADTLATPCATSATPDPADPAAEPAPEAGAAPAHDAAPAFGPHDAAIYMQNGTPRRVTVDGRDMFIEMGDLVQVIYKSHSLTKIMLPLIANVRVEELTPSQEAPATSRAVRHSARGTR